MASIVNDANGRRRILFIGPDQVRKAIRLGKCDRKSAESFCRHVESLLSARETGESLRPTTAAWLSDLGPKFRRRLAVLGLVEPEDRMATNEFLKTWLDGKKANGYKPASLIAWGQTVKELAGLLGARPLVELTHADGEAYRAAMKKRGLRLTTINKRLIHARQMLEDAVRFRHLSANPWKHVRQRQGDPSERRAYVSISDAQRVIDHCPNVWWKLLVALARFAGLRTPSESFSLTWNDVDWERARLSVPSPKTEASGKTHRVIPLFPLLRPHIEAAFELAEEGATFIVPEEYRKRAHGPGGWANANLRTTLAKVIRRAGVEPWPRLWHSLRASCESDLAQTLPLSTVTKWLGNTPSVALRHYVDPTEVAFERAATWVPSGGSKSGALAAQKAAQRVAVGSGGESHDLGVNDDGVATCATPCESPHDNEHASSGGAGN
jgi:integrase